MKEFLIVAGARPNFMKIAPLIASLKKRGVHYFLVHTGQHYDPALSDVFFKELSIPAPDAHLGVGSAPRIEQTQKIVQALLPILQTRNIEAILTVGDVMSTAAAAMAGVTAGVPIVHIEAGLRSYNWQMPEELNRMIADHYSELLFTPDEAAARLLYKEGINREHVFVVGNIMIDSLMANLDRLENSSILSRLDLQPKTYGLLTLHRGENVDDKETFSHIWSILEEVAKRHPLVFPMHPRTRARVKAFGFQEIPNMIIIEPTGYIDLLQLMKHASFALTDSGGIQEETTVLSIPCLTLRTETERPVTEDIGTNLVVGHDKAKTISSVECILRGDWKQGNVPELWDGKTAERIADILINHEF